MATLAYTIHIEGLGDDALVGPSVNLNSGGSASTGSGFAGKVAQLPLRSNDTASLEKTNLYWLVTASKTEFNGVMAHLRSLLWAYLEGEKVLFRFYDPVVIMPMLAVMSDGDRSQFLGNISHWLHWQCEEYTRYENHSPLAFTLQTNPWWRVKSEHLTAKEDHTTLATNIERALWRVLPTAINKLANPKQFIEKALQQFPSMYATSVDRQIYVLAHLIKAEIVNINDVVDVLHLSLTEREQLEYVIGALK